MSKKLAETFCESAESIRIRKNRQENALEPLHRCAKILGAAIAESDDTADDVLVRAAAPMALRLLYPRYQKWEGTELLELLTKMHELMLDIASAKPVVVHDLDDAMHFCAEMRAELTHMIGSFEHE